MPIQQDDLRLYCKKQSRERCRRNCKRNTQVRIEVFRRPEVNIKTLPKPDVRQVKEPRNSALIIARSDKSLYEFQTDFKTVGPEARVWDILRASTGLCCYVEPRTNSMFKLASSAECQHEESKAAICSVARRQATASAYCRGSPRHATKEA